MAAGSGYDFLIDTGKLETLKSEINSKISAIEASLGDLSVLFTEMEKAEGWEGEAHDYMRSEYVAHQQDFVDAVTYLKAYESMVGKVLDSGATLYDAVIAACNIE